MPDEDQLEAEKKSHHKKRPDDPLADVDPDLRAQALISKIMRETHSVYHASVRRWFHARFCIRDEAKEGPPPEPKP